MADLYGDLDASLVKIPSSTNGTESQTISAPMAPAPATPAASSQILPTPKSNLRDGFLKDLLTSLETLQSVNSTLSPTTPELKELRKILDLATPIISELIKLRSFVASSLVLDSAPLVSRLCCLISSFGNIVNFWTY